jgi:PilZ domain-containing protein
MDKRREPRFRTDQPVVVTVLTEPPTRLDARVTNASGRGLGLCAATPIPPGAPIRIEIDDAIVLGEAIYCRSDVEGHFIGVELDQVLVGLTELARTLAGFSPECAVEPRCPDKIQA